MSGEDFNIVAENVKNGPDGKARDCGGGCPLAMIPASVWRDLLRPPFRRRHPIVFWLLIFCAIAAVIMGGRAITGAKAMGGERIALVAVSGPIMNVYPTLEWIGKVENNPDVKGVLLRVDSPGGGAAASQEVYAALARLAKKKPVVASMGATAASGGLMVSMAAEKIYANPSTVTGSIGVRMDIPQLQELMGALGIGQETLVAGEYKDAASYLKPLTPKDRAYLQNILNDMHSQFVEIVATGRKMSQEKAQSLANGKIYTGQEAKALGLVDELGGQAEALAWLAQKTGVPDTRGLLKRPEKKSFLARQILGLASALLLDGDISTKLGEMARNFAQPAFLYQ